MLTVQSQRWRADCARSWSAGDRPHRARARASVYPDLFFSSMRSSAGSRRLPPRARPFRSVVNCAARPLARLALSPSFVPLARYLQPRLAVPSDSLLLSPSTSSIAMVRTATALFAGAALLGARAVFAQTTIQSPALYQCTPASFEYTCACVPLSLSLILVQWRASAMLTLEPPLLPRPHAPPLAPSSSLSPSIAAQHPAPSSLARPTTRRASSPTSARPPRPRAHCRGPSRSRRARA